MTKDKATTPYLNKTLGAYASQLLQKCSKQRIVSSNNSIHLQFGEILVEDEIGAGPIAGLYSGLKHSDTDWNIVLACDTPLLTLNIMTALLDVKADYDAVIAVDGNGKIHPLIGCYHKRILPIIEAQVATNRYALMKLLAQLNVKEVHFKDVKAFQNMNRLEDLNAE